MKKTAAIITVSDKGSRGQRVDESGKILEDILQENDFDVVQRLIVPDEMQMIQDSLKKLCDKTCANLILTTGGTGFSKRDVTPEATLSVIEKQVPGIPELMRVQSLKITDRASLSRAVSGIRKNSLIVNLPGSPKGASENLLAILSPIKHGIEILLGDTSECAEPLNKKKQKPSIDEWLKEAKSDKNSDKCGMYLFHNGVVRVTAREKVREGTENTKDVKKIIFSYDEEKVKSAVSSTKKMNGIYYVRVWLNEGELDVSDDIMLVLVGGDIRPHVIDALQELVGYIKTDCVTEEELYK